VNADPRHVVETAIARLTAHDLDGYYELLADDVTYRDASLECHGKGEVRALDEPVFTLIPDHWRRIDKLLVSGNVVAMWGTFGGTLSTTGTAIEVEACVINDVCDGKIRSIVTYADWSSLLDAVG
jgi:ketosteroid isomerase-like protein